MPARWLAPLAALALPAAPAAAQIAPPALGAQALFEQAIVQDTRTTPAIRTLLQTDAGFVAPSFGDFTGDGRMDAVAQVRMPGAAGTVAVYALSTDGTSDGRLRIVLRSQALYRATAAVAAGTVAITVPRYARGDEVCCPAARTVRRYVWSARARRLVRRH